MTRNNKIAGEAFSAIIGSHEFIKGVKTGDGEASHIFSETENGSLQRSKPKKIDVIREEVILKINNALLESV